MEIYPRAKSEKAVTPLVKSTVAAAILTILENTNLPEEQRTKAAVIGPVLNGSDDVKTFNEVWDEIKKERDELASIDPSRFKNEGEYKSSLASKKRYLDDTKWTNGMLAKYGAENFGELKSKLIGA